MMKINIACLFVLAAALGCSDDDNSVTPSKECDRYLDCVLVATPGAYVEALRSYGTDSPCWASIATTRQCAKACSAAYTSLAKQVEHQNYAACGGSGPDPDFGVGDGAVDGGGATIDPTKVDILFVIDDSGSMEQEQANLLNNFPKLIDALRSPKLGADGSGNPCS
jgi:hypothetical protein